MKPRTNPSEIAEQIEDFEGFRWIPGVGKVLDGLADMDAAARQGLLSLDATQTLLSILGNPTGTDIQSLAALVVRTLTGPDNQALTGLPSKTRKALEGLGALHEFETEKYAVREHTNEAAGLISDTTFRAAISPRGVQQ